VAEFLSHIRAQEIFSPIAIWAVIEVTTSGVFQSFVSSTSHKDNLQEVLLSFGLIINARRSSILRRIEYKTE